MFFTDFIEVFQTLFELDKKNCLNTASVKYAKMNCNSI